MSGMELGKSESQEALFKSKQMVGIAKGMSAAILFESARTTASSMNENNVIICIFFDTTFYHHINVVLVKKLSI